MTFYFPVNGFWMCEQVEMKKERMRDSIRELVQSMIRSINAMKEKMLMLISQQTVCELIPLQDGAMVQRRIDQVVQSQQA